ncbi:MAG: hypothetical protein U0U46_13790 [Saprospiraceae bacterium]
MTQTKTGHEPSRGGSLSRQAEHLASIQKVEDKNLVPALRAGAVGTKVPSPLSSGDAETNVQTYGDEHVSKADVSSASVKLPPKIWELIKSGLRKGIEKESEELVVFLGRLCLFMIAWFCLKNILGVQINLETLKALKEAFPFF